MTSIQIFSPHIDDAVFSLGGSILNWGERGIKVKVHNIFTISNWVAPNSIAGIKGNLSLHEVTAMRRNEEVLASEELKFDFNFWGYSEFPLRRTFSELDDEKMKDEILDRIYRCLNDDDFFFFPMGVEHEDHLLIKDLAKNFKSKGFNIFYYEDLPYVSWGNFDYHEAFKLQLIDKIPIVERIDYNRKVNTLRKYPSQVREEFISSMRAYSYNHIDNQYYERYWKQK